MVCVCMSMHEAYALAALPASVIRPAVLRYLLDEGRLSVDTGGVDEAPIELPIDGTLDLHGFRPADTDDLVRTYLLECRKRGILQVRIVHGKGIGALRETVHATLRRIPEVVTFGLAPAYLGGWGATMAELKPPE